MYKVVATGELFTSNRYFRCNSLIVYDFLAEGESIEDFKKRTGITSDIDRFSNCAIVDVASDAIDFKIEKPQGD